MTDALSLKLGRPTALRGNPFHGLVKGGQLTLPNGATMPYPQPGGEHWQQGSTALIRHPNAPGITRTSEEQSEDAAAGRQWWDRAILSGNQLYGKELPGWIYIDPNGDRWLVTTTLSSTHLSGGVCTVTLARFGVLGGEPLTYSYDVVVPNMGQSTPTISGTTGTRVQRYHSSPTGNAAVFEVAVEYSQGYERFWRWRPVGWVEMTLAGPGASCAAAVTVLKSRAQALGGYTYQDTTVVPDDYYLNRQPDGTKKIEQTPGADIAATLVTHNMVTSPETSAITGWVVGMNYDAQGSIQETTLDIQTEWSWVTPAMIYTGPDSIAATEEFVGSFSMEQSWLSTMTLTYRSGGAVVGTYALEIREASTEVLTYSEGGAKTNAYSVQIDCTPGGSFSASATKAAANVNVGGLYTYGFYTDGAPRIGRRVQQWWFEDGQPWRYLQPCPYRYSNQLFGLCLWGRPLELTDYLFQADYLASVASPKGMTALPAVVLVKSDNPTNDTFDLFAYASHCPVTGQTARDSEPVCYV